MTPDWTPLTSELDRWRDAGLTLPLWWRDDDAITRTPALDRLSGLAERVDVPVHLAVIPALAEQPLGEHLRDAPHLIPLVHGWTHQSHAPQGEKKAEFGDHRPIEIMIDDARQGLARLSDLVEARLCPIFVPPWNRIAPQMITELQGLGYFALSTFTPRAMPLAAPGVAQFNTHLDPIDWRGTRSLADPGTLIRQVANQLADRRQGHADNDEPYGILTHHLVHDTAIWGFTEQLLSRLTDGPVHHWTMPPPQPEKETTA